MLGTSIGGLQTLVAAIVVVGTMVGAWLFVSGRQGPAICIINNSLSNDGSVCDLRGKGITPLPPNSFKEPSGLEKIYLNENQLKSLPTRAFNDLPNLEELDLSDNKLSDLTKKDIFKNLESLETLRLSGNQLTKLPPNIFKDLESLENVSLSRNNLLKLPKEIFNRLSNLEEIDLSQNKLTNLPRDIFKHLKSLEKIDLSENRLDTLPSDIFTGLNIKEIRLHGNKMVCMPNLPGTLRFLSVNDNSGEKNKINTHGLDPCP